MNGIEKVRSKISELMSNLNDRSWCGSTDLEMKIDSQTRVLSVVCCAMEWEPQRLGTSRLKMRASEGAGALGGYSLNMQRESQTKRANIQSETKWERMRSVGVALMWECAHRLPQTHFKFNTNWRGIQQYFTKFQSQLWRVSKLSDQWPILTILRGTFDKTIYDDSADKLSKTSRECLKVDSQKRNQILTQFRLITFSFKKVKPL